MTARALVIGGTGPTGPYIVEALAQRDYDVTILHGGQHEYDFVVPVRHIHEDPHFAETLERGIGDETFDVVISQYGRLSVIADVFAGRAGHFIAIGAATGIYAVDGDPRWGRLGRPALFPDTTTLYIAEEKQDKLKYRMRAALDRVFEHHAAGDYSATYVGYPNNYGPRQPGPQDWSILRRLLDGRPAIVIADGGIKLESRVCSRNAAAGVVAVIDNLDRVGGKRYSVADERAYTMRQRIQLMSDFTGVTPELVDMPYDLAWPCHPFYRFRPQHLLCQSDSIRRDLGYEDVISTDDGLWESFEWLIDNQPERGGELERQTGDPFDYAAEDVLIKRWQDATSSLSDIESPLPGRSHMYRHPKSAGEIWKPAQ